MKSKLLKGSLSVILSLIFIISAIPAGAIDAIAEAIPSPEYIYGDSDGITRAEWLHNLITLFDMEVSETATPDNYFCDLSEEHEYYDDIMIAVSQGIISIEAGDALLPDEAVTRDFAVYTLNYCLGYEPLEEEVEYTFSDYTECSSPFAAKTALDRGWVEAIDGNFVPDAIISKNEVRSMIADAEETLEATVIDPDYDSTFEFSKEITVIDENVSAKKDNSGNVIITGCPETISKGESFAVFFNGLPEVFSADKVTVKGNETIIAVTEADVSEVYTDIDAQGIAAVDVSNIVAAEGVEIEFQEGVSSRAIDSEIKVHDFKLGIEIEIMDGVTIEGEFEYKNPRISYKIALDRAYVIFEADLESSYKIKGDALKLGGIPDEVAKITLFTLPVAGVGSLDVDLEFKFEGELSGSFNGDMKQGVEVTTSSFRALREFNQTYSHFSAKAEASVALSVKFGITKMPCIKAYIFFNIGFKGDFGFETYSDGQSPKTCSHVNIFLFAEFGGTASVKLGIFSFKAEIKEPVYDENNSPVRIVHHYEDGMEVSSCSRGKDFKYFTDTSTSKWGSGGGGGSSFGITKHGSPFTLYEYNVDNKTNEATITKYHGKSFYVSIPETLDGHKVVAIGDGAFQNSNLFWVGIPDSVTSIGSYAFDGCSAMCDITLPDDLTFLGGRAFGNCGIENVKIPKYLEKCGTVLNRGVWEFIYTYNGIEYSMRGGPFYGCDALRSVTFEKGTRRIAESVLESAPAITSVTIPDSAVEIGKHAFASCISLNDVKMGDSVTKIDENAFDRCVSLEAIDLSSSLSRIENYAFSNCSSLKAIKLPDSLQHLGGRSFGESGLREIKIPAGLTSAGYVLDRGIYEYPVTYNDKTYNVKAGPFYLCKSLTKASFEDGITTVPSHLFAAATSLTGIKIPDSVESIEEGAFRDCFRLTNINIGSGVKKINRDAFYQDLELKVIDIPKSCERIEGNAFGSCTSLRDVHLSEGLKYIGGNAFAKAGIVEITIPSTVTEGGYDLNRGIWEYDIYHGDTKYTTRAGAFFNCENLKTVYFAEGSGIIPSHILSGAVSVENVIIPEGVTEIGMGAFRECFNLKEIDLPSSVTKIGERAFARCVSVTDVRFNNALTLIDYVAFGDCTSLENIDFSNASSLKTIRNAAFENTAVTDVVLPVGLEALNNAAFQKCKALRSVYIPESVKTVGPDLFRGCVSLVDVTMSDYGFDTLQEGMFRGCTALYSITLPKGLKYINKNVFYESPSLSEVFIPESVVSIADNAFASSPAGTVFIGHSGSYAEEFANKKEFTFIDNTIPVSSMSLANGMTDIYLEVGEVFRAAMITDPASANDVITYSAQNNRVSIQGRDIKARNTGDCVITAKATSGAVFTFTIHIKNVNSLSVSTEPKKATYYKGENLDLSGLIINANYNNGETKEITDYTVEGFDSSSIGESTVTVKWTAIDGRVHSTSFKVNVVERPPMVGDVNSDGQLNAKDSNLLKQFISGENVEIRAENADINNDGTISSKDANLLKQILSGSL